MWTDETGAAHTIWVPPAAILGEEAVAALRDLPADVRAATVADLDGEFDRIFDAAAAEAPPGPREVDDPDDLDQPPLVPGPVPRAGESLTATVLTYLERLPLHWRVEALEAIVDVLEEE